MSFIKRGKSNADLLRGSLWKQILLFAIPIALSSMLQQLFNSADSVVVGRFVGSDAISAVGNDGSVVNLFIYIFTGLSVGANVVIAGFLGREDYENAKTASQTAVIFSLICGALMTVIGFFCAEPILRLLNTPESIMGMAVAYLKVYMLGGIFVAFYNFGAAILRSNGDSASPVICLVVSGVVNVLLNLLFVIVFRMGVVGVALATVISAAVSCLLLIYFLLHMNGAFQFDFKNMKINGKMLWDTVRIGFPASVQSAVFSMSNLYIMSAMNTLDNAAIASVAITRDLDHMVGYVGSAFAQAVVTFTGQNYAAGNEKRCREITRVGLVYSVVISLIMGVLFTVFTKQIVSIWTDDPAIIACGRIRVLCLCLPYAIYAVSEIFCAGMRGRGVSLLPALVTIAGVCGLRVLWVLLYFPQHRDILHLSLAYPVTWAITAMDIFICYIFVIRSHRAKATSLT